MTQGEANRRCRIQPATHVDGAEPRLDRLTADWIDTCDCPTYRHVRLSLRAEGSTQALAAVQEFLRGSWFCAPSLPYVQRALALMDGDGMNLREEGQAIRSGDRLLLWSGMSYFERGVPEADVDFAEFCEVLRPFLQVIQMQDRVTCRGARLARAAWRSGSAVELLRFERDTPPVGIRRSADLRFHSARMQHGFSLHGLELQGEHHARALEVIKAASEYIWEDFSQAMLDEDRPIWWSSKTCIVREGDWVLIGAGRDKAIAIEAAATRRLIVTLKRIEALSKACRPCKAVLHIVDGQKPKLTRA
jgi:hypothetical protein